MNSTWKLLPAGLLLAVLAGCGGGGGGEMMEPEPTPEEECLAGDGVVYEDGTCKTADDLRAEGRDAEAEEREKADADKKAADEAMATQMSAKALQKVLEGVSAFTDKAGATLDDRDDHSLMSVAVMGKAFEDAGITGYVSATNTLTFTVDGSTADARIAGSGFSTAGSKEHDTNRFTGTGNDRVGHFDTGGTYYGVSGTYTCTPATGSTAKCSTSRDAATGNLILGPSGHAWTFKPADAKARVTDGKSVEYGWWADVNSDTGLVTAAGVFHGPATGTALADNALTIGGKATYTGSAVGKYAIHRGAGSENAAGHFTADATLNAVFGTEATISGMIDNFNAGGESVDWTVALQKQQITGTGVFQADRTDSDPLADGASGYAKTVWSMGDSKAAADGMWQGGVYGAGGTAAPTAASGAFTSTYGNIGNMVGAFGAK